MELEEAARILRDPTRRRILRLLAEEGPLEYSEILRRLGLKSTGKLNYHLKLLAPYLEKDEQGRYLLSSEGEKLYRLMAGLGMYRANSLEKVLAIVLAAVTVILASLSLALILYGYEELGNAFFLVTLSSAGLALVLGSGDGNSQRPVSFGGLARANLPPLLVAVLLLLFLTAAEGTRFKDVSIWSFLLVPPMLSWALTAREYGISADAAFWSGMLLTIPVFILVTVPEAPSTPRGLDPVSVILTFGLLSAAYVFIPLILTGLKILIRTLKS